MTGSSEIVPTVPPVPPALFAAEQLQLPWEDRAPAQDLALSFELRPGLSFVCGGEGRGKTRLLRLIAGEIEAAGGRARRGAAAAVCFERPADAAHDALRSSEWLAHRQAGFAASWQASRATALVEAFGLAEHMAKPMYMLSTGSRRKLGLVAAAASGAALTLLDQPYAALDARSARLLSELLVEAAADPRRAWVLADYALPTALAGLRLAARIELGD
ncbi:MAG: ATP-binding cassette domain-containing protein [Burkholderiaceae bacterium]